MSVIQILSFLPKRQSFIECLAYILIKAGVVKVRPGELSQSGKHIFLKVNKDRTRVDSQFDVVVIRHGIERQNRLKELLRTASVSELFGKIRALDIVTSSIQGLSSYTRGK